MRLERLADSWTKLHTRRRLVRWPVKAAVFLAVLFLVCFPSPRRLWRHLDHHRHADRLLTPAPDLIGPMLERAKAVIDPSAPHGEQLRQLQAFVEREVPYAFDWEVWGAVDYLPTFEEVLTAGREDCDGRAVVAASLLRAMGHEARLVGNPLHIWVWTPWGETMSPQEARLMEITEEGWRLDWRGLRVIPEGLAFGAAVFPLNRELILAATLWLLMLRPLTSWREAGFRALLCLATVFLLRASSPPHAPMNWTVLGAAGLAFVGVWAVGPWPVRRKRAAGAA